MNINYFKSDITKLIKQRNSSLLIIILLLISNIILAAGLFMKKQKVIIVPAYLKQSVWSEGELVSESYLEEMSLFFTKLMLDTTPTSLKSRRDIILRYIHPKYFHAMEKKLIEEERNLKRSSVATVFIPKRIEVNTKNFIARITGEITTYVAGSRIGQKLVKYDLHYAYSGGILMLSKFTSN